MINNLTISKKNWINLKFSNIADNIVEKVIPKESKIHYYVGLENLSSDSIHINEFGDPSNLKGDKLVGYKNDVILGKRNAYLKRAAILDRKVIASAHSFILRVKENVMIPELFIFFLNSEIFWNTAIKISVGSLSPTINWKTLAKQNFLIPPLNEQKKLADLLWAGDELSDFYSKLKSSLNKSEKCYVKSIFDNFDKQSFVMLGDVCDISGGSTPSTKNSSYWDGDVNWLTPKEITNFKSKYLSETEKKITQEGLKSISNKLYPIGTVAMSTRATIGNIIIMGERMSTNQGFTNFICGKDIINEFLYIVLKFLTPSLLRLGSGSTFLEISKSDIRRFKIPLPSIEIQKEIIKNIGEIQEKISQLEKTTFQLNSINYKLRNEIFN